MGPGNRCYVKLKKTPRRFAKRQFTWFRKNEQIKWFDISTPTSDIIEFTEEKIISSQ